jgi:hypothetical protein
LRLEDVLTQLRLDVSPEVFRPHWEESEAGLPDGIPSFLQPEEIRRNHSWSSLAPETEPSLLDAAARIRQEPALVMLAWHCYRLLYEHVDYEQTREWPALEPVLKEQSGAFYLLIALGLVPRVLELHRKMGVSEDITRETLQQIACYSRNYRRMTDGGLGIPVKQLYWLRHYDAGRLFRVGRFEYMLRPFRAQIGVYRHRHTGRVIALAPDGVCYNKEGYVDGTAGVADTEHGWTATFAEDDEVAVGYPISPLGYAVNRQVRLEKGLWECVLRHGDTTLEMHIPEGGGMTLDRCANSFRRATAFFERQFPDQPFNSISSTSWIFNNQLQEIRLSSENLARFQRELYLYPVRSSGQDGLWFIFLREPLDLAKAPRQTSLQQAVADFILAGNTWRNGGMFFLTEHLPCFGTQYYRSQALDICRERSK